MKRVLFPSLALLSVCLACSAAPSRPWRAVVLFDLSGSGSRPSIRAAQLDGFSILARAVAAQGGSVYAESIGGNPSAMSTTPVAVSFTPPPQVEGNGLFEKAHAAKQLEAAVAQAREVLSRPSEGGSDIFSALLLAERIFARAGKNERRYLVLFSDMVEHAGRYDFYRQPLDVKATRSVLATLRRSGMLPRLAGVRVYVAGAGVDPNGTLTSARAVAIERFWHSYFRATGATLATGHYSARLVEFP